MGGDRSSSLISSSEEESLLLDQEFPELSLGLPSPLGKDGLRPKVEDNDGTPGGENGVVFGEFDDVGRQISSSSLDFEADQRRRRSAYREVLEGYNGLRQRNEDLAEAKSKILRKDGLRPKVEDNDDTPGGENGVVFGEFDDVGRQISSSSLDFEADQRRRRSAYREVLEGYKGLRQRSEDLAEAKSKILSYIPGAWIEKVGGMKSSDYDIPKTTSLLLIGPKGSGKSTLVNRITRVFEDDKFASDRAQVSYNSSVGDGTYFLQEYMIPRSSTSFCLYDTRSLSDDSSENMEMLEHWMTKGVHHGELVIRDSDSSTLKTRMNCKARQSGYYSSERRMVNFVIFVVNGLSVLKSMDGDNQAAKHYTQLIATTFNLPFLSFKDDKPVIIVTHGDLLSISDRARVRVHLGELLGIPPMKQIFDIPESCGPETELVIVDMLRYSLEHADRNLPGKEWFSSKVGTVSLQACLFLLIILWIAIITADIHGIPIRHGHKHHVPPSNIHIDWRKIRHLWL